METLKKPATGLIVLLFGLSLLCVMGCPTDGGGSSTTSSDLFSKPGTYTATATGNAGELTVRAVYSANKIDSVTVTACKDTEAIAMVPVQRIPAETVQYQVLDVDSVTGATVTSAAIKAAIEDTAVQAGGDLARLNVKPPAGPTAPYTIETDVLVVGSGISGLFAAYEAAETSDVKVTLIDKVGFFGGTTSTNGGIFQGVNNFILQSEGVTDSADKYYEFLTDLSLEKADLSMLRHVSDNSQDTIEAAVKMGIKFNATALAGPPGAYPSFYNERYLEPRPFWTEYTERKLFDNPSGDKTQPSRALWANLWVDDAGVEHYGDRSADGSFITIPIVKYLQEELEVEFYKDMDAKELIVEGGAVKGVKAKDRYGADVTINASKGVVLATGGFHDNPTMMSEFHPMLVLAGRDPSTRTIVGAQGDGITMGKAAGAAVDMTASPIAAVSSVVEDKGIWVTPEGNRYKDEAMVYPMSTTGQLFNLGFHYQWTIMNNTDRPANLAASPDGTDPITTPSAVFTADTIADLAAIIFDGNTEYASNLQEAIDAYDAAIPNDVGKNDEFAARTLPLKDKYAVYPDERHKAIGNVGPFWAQRSGRFGGTFAGTRGGLRIDVDGKVISNGGSAIPGLFAAGEVANAKVLPLKYGGSGMAMNIYATMGRRAGKVAATGTW